MNVLVIGSEGSMGKRYQCILKYLGARIYCADINTPFEEISDFAEDSDRIIVATPTGTHYQYIHNLFKTRKPILCEKPLSKSPVDLASIRALVKNDGLNLSMMMQYEMLDPKIAKGHTEYNYFRHGSDGLYWDCIQPIGLARGSIKLYENSPIWQCKLNGHDLNLSDMDWAYVEFVKRWLKHPGADIDRLLRIHFKVMELENEKAS